MAFTFFCIHTELSSSGLLNVTDRLNFALDEVLHWLREIGATQTLDYFTAYRALFPPGEVPSLCDDRHALLKSASGGSRQMEAAIDPLDAKYREPALEEIPAKLRVYLAANSDRIESGQPL
jgi:hypothetical protein